MQFKPMATYACRRVPTVDSVLLSAVTVVTAQVELVLEKRRHLKNMKSK
jgi:hypothetical protein